MKRTRKSNRGIAAIEFALILPIFLVMLLGLIDYGYYFFIELAATNASREGARTATTFAGGCPNADGSAAALSAVNSRMAAVGQAGNTSTTVSCSTGAGGDPEMQVQVVVTFPQLTGFSLIPMPGPGGGMVQASAQATMRGVP